jgi:hypothetical protein
MVDQRRCLSESDFLDTIIDVAYFYGWKPYHVRAAWSKKGWRTPIKGDKGFPDLVLARPPRVIFAELKSDVGKLSREQNIWRDCLLACPGVEYYVWQPSMWAVINGVLKNDNNQSG